MKIFKTFSSCKDLMGIYSDTSLIKAVQEPKEAVFHQLIHLVDKENVFGDTNPSNFY